jgi:hypothetical protein
MDFPNSSGLMTKLGSLHAQITKLTRIVKTGHFLLLKHTMLQLGQGLFSAPPEAVDAAVIRALQTVSGYCRADRAAVYGFVRGGDTLNCLYEWRLKPSFMKTSLVKRSWIGYCCISKKKALYPLWTPAEGSPAAPMCLSSYSRGGCHRAVRVGAAGRRKAWLKSE